MARTTASLAVDRMSSRRLFGTLLTILYRLDPGELSYSPGQARKLAFEGRQIVLELRERGTQLTLLES